MGGYENLGPGVSQTPQNATAGAGQFSSEDRSFETVVFQQNNPPMDWEWNLMQSVLGTRTGVQARIPSCFISGDFLESDGPGPSGSFSFIAPDPGVGSTANQFILNAADLIVNGWNVRLEYSNTNAPGQNVITLPAPPAGAARQDLVILEVWRALISPAPSTSNKSPGGQILRHGNALAPDAPNVNLADDLLDPSYLQETAKRVQIQYRLRVFPGANLGTYPDGLEDPSIVANTVPYLGGPSVDGVPSIYAYSAHSSDTGLWVAGTNDSVSATALGTVDGLMYAIPVCCVFRKNSTAFDRSANMNGGTLMAAALVSDRPDGIFCDQIVAEDILDMRKTSTLNDRELMESGVRALLRNTLSTNFDASGLGTFGPTVSMRDSTGPVEHMLEPDGVRVRFSNAVTSHLALEASVQGAPYTSVTFDLTSVDLPWAAAVNVKAKAPPGTSITSVVSVHVVTGSNDYDAFDPGSPYVVDNVTLSAAPGPEVDSVTVTFTGPVPASTCYIEFIVEYPNEVGLSRNIVEKPVVWAPASLPLWADPAGFAVTSDVNRLSVVPNYVDFNPLRREVSVVYLGNAVSSVFQTCSTTTVFVPDMVDVATVTVAGKVVSTVERGAMTKITFAPPVAVAGDPVTVGYSPLRPVPQLGAAPNDTIDCFYKSRGWQSLPVPAGIQTVNFAPRVFSESAHVVAIGSGSHDSPLSQFSQAPGEQIPFPGLYPDSTMDGPPMCPTVLYRGAGHGYVAVPVVSPFEFNPAATALYNDGGPSVDSSGRSYWAYNSPSGPFVFAVAASMAGTLILRKVFHSAIVELTSDFPSYGRKGSLFLVLYTRSEDRLAENILTIGPPLSGFGVAAVYKLRGNPIGSRRFP